jgi:polyisoprenoid-binding protein YceI
MALTTEHTKTATFDPELTGSYSIDTTHSRVGFVARHALVTKVRGSFNDFDGAITVDAENPENSKVEVTIQVASVDTRNEQRDDHLRTNDFFDAQNFPTITFRSTAVQVVDAEHLQVEGDLTIRGVTKPVTLEAEFAGGAVDAWGKSRIGFDAKTVINRKDFGVNWNAALEAGGVLVSEQITIELEISAVKAS